MKPALAIKRIYDAPSDGDGARILVDRLWPRGIAKDDAALTLWLKEIAPSDELRKSFGHEPAEWPAFRRRYRAELDANPDSVGRLRAYLRKGKVTLLYAARDTERNNAVALADYIRETK